MAMILVMVNGGDIVNEQKIVVHTINNFLLITFLKGTFIFFNLSLY
ncbi:protein of unknown function [Brochothrix thermosphacta]|nr:protein of unknown function [Brochothrix thermosphacta]SPP30136.1 hypothetical protein BTTAP_60139 [Brochothrix thermosphacta]